MEAPSGESDPECSGGGVELCDTYKQTAGTVRVAIPRDR